MAKGKETELNVLIKKRERVFRWLQTSYDLIATLPDKEDVFLARGRDLDGNLRYYEELQDRLEAINIAEGKEVVSVNSTAYEELHYMIKSQVHTIMTERQAAEGNDNPPIVHEVRNLRPQLPPINIPKFQGDLEKFPAFKSLYDTLVHNTDLTPIQKFSFLKSYLDPPALNVIDHLNFTEANYNVAYKRLTDRYTDKRIVGTHYFKKLSQFKPLVNGSSHGLRQFLDVFCVHYESLKALAIPDLSDFFVFNIAMQILDADTKRLFEEKYSNVQFPTFENLMAFVQDQYKVASLMQAPNVRVNNQVPLPNSNVHGSKFNNNQKKYGSSMTKSFVSNVQDTSVSNANNPSKTNAQKVIPKCPLCQTEHKLMSCTKFTSMSPTERSTTVQSLKLCYACLGRHPRFQCMSKFKCLTCKSKGHHTMLHRDPSQTPIAPSNPQMGHAGGSYREVPPMDDLTNSFSGHTKSDGVKVKQSTGLIGTALVRIRSLTGEWKKCRIIIDPASESSFITESLAQGLGLPRRKCPVDIVGVGSTKFSSNRGCVSCQIAPIQSEISTISVDAIVLQSISSHMPKVPLDPLLRTKFMNLQLADPDFDKPRSVDMLLGVQHYSEILSDNLIHIKGEPSLINTIFGFLVFGKVPINSNNETRVSMFTCTPSMDEMLQQFWESEELLPCKPLDPNDIYCEKFFKETTTRDQLGRYSVSLPFKDGKRPESLGSTRKVAHQRLLNLERKLLRTPEIKDQDNSNLQDYVTQNHMQQASSEVDYLLTHHAVMKDSSTTKVRVVFNASQKSDTSQSLNDFLLSGPKLQTDIALTLLNFRLNPVALIADIKQMYRCIRLHPRDVKYNHLLWRPDPSQPIVEWELVTLPFGLTSSPYLAQRVIKQLVEDEGSSFPEAAAVLSSDIYVDDIVSSSSTEEDAVELYHQLKDLLNRGGFTLRKFASNSPLVLSHIPSDHHETSISFNSNSCIKLLGFHWNPSNDMFCYKLSLETPLCTKRGLLSQVARIFDVNGYLAPITFWIKYLIQRLWLAGSDWDRELPDDLKQAWLAFHSQLPKIASINISRWLNCKESSMVTIVGFCDASEKGYAACIYLRLQLPHHGVKISLLKAKSKVAPLKSETIPRLELNGAVLLSKLLLSIKDFLERLPSHEVFCFTDSTVVLSWLRTPPHMLKTFVANRVVQVTEVTPPSYWNHVSGTDNPADVASRGCYPDQLIASKLWWKGPKFIYRPLLEWPLEKVEMVDPIPERKPETTALLTHNNSSIQSNDLIDTILERSSSLPKAQRNLCYVRRFVSKCQRAARMRNPSFRSVSIDENHFMTEELGNGIPKGVELSRSLDLMMFYDQQSYFPEIIDSVKNGRPVKGLIRHLTPFISEGGLLRVGGRLALAPLPFYSRHPVLMSRRGRLAELICQFYHTITLHGGPQLMQSLIQRKFWIPGVRSLLRSVVFKCIPCYRFKAKPVEPLMSSLPSLRFQKVRPFVNTGVDFAGPFQHKESKRRNARSHKCWIVLFICMRTRAVYVDVVSDLTTVAFLASLDRFIARRGIPSKLLSDLGTNFVGAARQLREVFDFLSQLSDQFRAYCEARKIIWEFNPPAAPHFGGSWEAAIKGVKHHLKRVVADKPLTYEELSTLVARIEAILNSRPLCPLPSSPLDGFDYLTPGHFLVGAPMVLSRPELDHLDQPINMTCRWKSITRSVQDMWQRWSHEYIQTLIQRPKWDRQVPNLKPNQMVLLWEKNLPPTSWLVGRIIEVSCGQDQVTRVATIRTPHGTLIRPIHKLCLLPIGDEDIGKGGT